MRPAGRTGAPVAPTREDPFAAATSAVVGGPLGTRAATGRSWWTPLAVLFAVTTVVFALGVVQKAPCEQYASTRDTVAPFTHLCYSDITYLYTERGFVYDKAPYVDEGDYTPLEYPVLTGAFMYVASEVTHALVGAPGVAGVPVDRLGGNPAVREGAVTFFVVNALLLFGCLLGGVWALAGVHRSRPWDALPLAAAPALALAALVNWDVLALALVCGALLAWSRSRPGVAGVLLGLGFAAKLYPVFLLGPLLIVCLRAGRMAAWRRCALATVVTWAAVNLPILVAAPGAWLLFWGFNAGRGGDFGSVWYVLAESGHPLGAGVVNALSAGLFLAGCGGVAVLGLKAPRRPRLPQLAFLTVAAFLLVNKVYSPQYVLWLLPLAVLARPRWRDLLIWQACEAVYFVGIWLHLAGALAPGTEGSPDRAYWVAVAVRIAGTVYLCGLVVRDILRPEVDPVRRTGQLDDPAGGVVDGVPDALRPGRRTPPLAWRPG